MADDQVRVYVDFPTYKTLPEDQKSFVNFFMENSSVFFRGEYDGSGNLLHMAGCIGLNCQNFHSNSNGDEVWANFPMIIYSPEGDIPDDSPFSLTKLSDHGESITTASGYYPEYPDYITTEPEFNTDYRFEDGIPECNTVLCTARSSLKLYSTSSYSSDYYPYFMGIDDTNMLSIPVNLSVKFEDTKKVNTDNKVLPTFIVNKDSNDYHISIMKTPIKRNGKTKAEYQLRTSSFTLVDESNQSHNVFYKIGLTLLSDEYSAEDIISGIKNLVDIRVALGGQGDSGFIDIFRLYDESTLLETDYHFRPEETTDIVKPGCYYDEDSEGGFVPISFVANTANNDGIVYFKMYEETEAGAVEVYDDSNIATDKFKMHIMYNNHDVLVSIYDSVAFAITDQNMDGGFVAVKSYTTDK